MVRQMLLSNTVRFHGVYTRTRRSTGSCSNSMRNMKTHYTGLQCILNLCQAYTGTSVPLLCRVELMLFRSVCLSWINLLNNTLSTTATLYQPMKTTSTSATFANTSATPVDADGSLDRFFRQERDEPDFVKLLEGSTSQQQISEKSLVIYHRAAESSTELVTSARMEDYVIDINIYQYVLLNYIF